MISLAEKETKRGQNIIKNKNIPVKMQMGISSTAGVVLTIYT